MRDSGNDHDALLDSRGEGLSFPTNNRCAPTFYGTCEFIRKFFTLGEFKVCVLKIVVKYTHTCITRK